MDGQSIWVVAFLLYVYDAISLRDRDATLRYSIGGLTALLIAPTLTIGRHRVFIANPFRPDQCDLVLKWQGSEALSLLDRYLLNRASWIYLQHQIVSIGALIFLFGLTPLLATQMNLFHACLITVTMTYLLCSLHWVEMWKNRKLLGINAKALRSDMLHVLFCPPNAVNCARRIAALRDPRYGVLPCLRAFSRYDAQKYQEQFLPLRGSA